jgi:HEAT repeat protein
LPGVLGTILSRVGLFGKRQPNVQRLKRRGKVDRLCEALRYRETFVDGDGTELDVGVSTRVEAAEALSEFDEAGVADALLGAVADPEPAVRLAAIDAIAGLDEPFDVEPLIDRVVEEQPESDVAARALDVLTRDRVAGHDIETYVERLLAPDAPLVEDRHEHALDRMLASDARSAQTRRTVAEKIVWRLQGPHDEALAERGERILGWLGPPGVDTVVDALANGRADPALVRAAGRAGDARAVESVVAALDSPDPEMRRSAALAAGALNHTDAVPELLNATQDPEQSVRDAASAALNRIGMAAVIVGLASLIGPLERQQAGTEADDEPVEDAGHEAAVEPLPASEGQPPAAPTDGAFDPSRPNLRAGLPAARHRTSGILERLLRRIEDQG